ncbi:hypothetical protein DMH88_12125 [Escherichia coli]|nr:hypothetical protein [Escherichia coli]
MVYEHLSGVYHYRVSRAFHLTVDTLTVTLAVTNQGTETLPFGTGWHPYFPLAPQTRGFRRRQVVTGWAGAVALAGEFCEQLPRELDFQSSRAVTAPVGKQWFCRMEW